MAYHFQRFIFFHQKMFHMSKFWEGGERIHAIASNPGWCTIHGVGVWFHWSYQSKFKPRHTYILIATDYFTKWKESRALKKEDTYELISFIEKNSLSSLGVPEKFITNDCTIFIVSKLPVFCGEYGTTMGKSSNYYSQGNGLCNLWTRHFSKSVRR